MSFLLNPSRFAVSGGGALFTFTTTGVNNNITPAITTSSGTAEWDLDDGTTPTTNSVSHTYSDGEASHDCSITGGVAVEDITSINFTNDEITSIDISNCTGITGNLWLYANDITGSLTIPNAPNTLSCRIQQNGNMTAVPGLDNLTGLNSTLYIDNCDLTGAVSIPNAPSCTYFNASGNSSLTSFTGLDKLTGLTGFLIASGCDITGTMTIPVATSLPTIDVNGNSNLTAFSTLSGLTSCNSFKAHNCGLTASAVDQVIIDLDAAGVLSGTLKLEGNAAPTAASATELASLVTKGWTVTTN